jgi:N-acetyl sugar amidotransferase
MQICSRCLYDSHHPLNLTFDERGVCSGCRVHEEKDRLDFAPRRDKLRQIAEAYRNRSGSNYDCVVPVSGARDSYFIVHTVKKELGLNPLLVTYNKQYNTDLGIRNLANLRIALGCDIMTLTVDPEAAKRVTRATLRRFGSMYWHCLAGQTVFPVTIAVKMKIPLIIWGAHQGLDQVGMFSHLDEVEMTRKYRKEHDLLAVEADELIHETDGVKLEHVRPFLYPEDAELERVGVRGIYLGNYLRWDSKAQHEAMLDLYHYETAIQTRTFDTYNDVDCFNYSDVHDYLKLVKHGYGKVTDHACREIRLGRLTREEAEELVEQYERREPRFLDQFLDWMGMNRSGWEFVLDHFRSPHRWSRNASWRWELQPRDPAARPSRAAIEAARLEKREGCTFRLTPSKRPDYADDRYILVGKGHPEL